MKTETKILGIILLATLILIFGAIFFLSKSSNTNDALGPQQKIDYSKGRKIGSDSAKLKLVEFSDFQCPGCRSAEVPIKQVLKTYPNEVQFIYRHFPLPQHNNGKKAAYLSEAAGSEGKFWEIHDRFFDTQTQWSPMKESDAQSYFIALTRELGLDENKMRQGMTSGEFKPVIEDDILEGKRLGVNSTPTFFLNGKKLNLQNFADLNTIIEEELKK